MVSSINVQGDSLTLKSLIDIYKSLDDNIDAYWKGDSFNNFEVISDDFISDCLNILQEQLGFYLDAVKMYENHSISEAKLEVYSKNKNNSISDYEAGLKNAKKDIDKYSELINKYTNEAKDYKNKINMYLDLVNKKKFDADALSYDVKCLSSMTFPKLDIISSTSSNTGSGTGTGSAIVTGSSTTTGDLKLNGNVVDTSNPVYTGEKYNLSDEELRYLAYVASREQGSVEGAKMELSLMANLYEKNKGSYSSVYDYVCNSGWFGSGSVNNYSYPGDDYYNVAKEVLNGGNRYLPSNVVEHDCIPDLTSISTGSVSDTSAYIPGQTIINNRYGASYVFVGFAPNGGDPFGYLV